jgi:phenylacetate-coenzyme A ligase PaaK-like adenylate-forming protein
MKGFLAQTLVPAVKTLCGRSYSQRLAFLNKSQWWSPEELREFQWRELQILLRIAFESVPFYRQKYAGIRFEDIRTWDDFRRLPTLTRHEVQQHLQDLRSTHFRGKSQFYSTGGSSGEPVRFYRSIESYDWRTAATDRVYAWSGLKFSESSLHLWGAPVGTPKWSTRLRTNIHNWTRNQTIMPTFVQSESVWRDIHAYALERKPKYLLGYVSSLTSFARFIEMFSLPVPHFVSIVAAAETLSERQREYLEKVFSAPVFNTYGSREFMSIGGECEKHEGLHLNAENLVVEAGEGEVGGASPILVSDLHNFATIFLRYAIGDLGTLSARRCSCGRGLPMLDGVVGRQNQTLRLSDGREVSSIFFRHTLKEIPEILEYQVVQLSLSHVVLKVVALPSLSQGGRALIEREFKKALGNAQLSIEVVKELEKSRSGKNPLFVSVVGSGEGLQSK